MPKNTTQDVETPAPTTQDVETPAVVDPRVAELEAKLAAAEAAVEEAELAKLEAEQAAEIAKREAVDTPEIDPEDKKVLDALAEGKSAEIVAEKLGFEKDVVLKVAYENMNNESVYALAERLSVKVNDIYKATEQHDMVRRIQYVTDEGTRKTKELDYEA